MVEGRIVLSDPDDVNFAKSMKGTACAGKTLPSGLVVPKHGDWVMQGTSIINKSVVQDDATYEDEPEESGSPLSFLDPIVGFTGLTADEVVKVLAVAGAAAAVFVVAGPELCSTLMPVFCFLGLYSIKAMAVMINGVFTAGGKVSVAVAGIAVVMVLLNLVEDLEEGGPDLVQMASDAYVNFRTNGEQGMPLQYYFSPDATFTPMNAVAGWQPQQGFENIMSQFANVSMYAGIAGFSVTPYDYIRAGNKVFVFEDITTDQGGAMKGVAVHTFNDMGKCVNVSPYHHTAAMTDAATGIPVLPSSDPSEAMSVKVDIPEEIDIKQLCEDAYLAFRTNGEEGLPLNEYWAHNATMNPMYPVEGFGPAEGLESILTTLGSLGDYPAFEGMSVVPYDMIRKDNKVFVFEDVVTTQAGVTRGLAIHTFNEEGKCIDTTPYHHSAALTALPMPEDADEDDDVDTAEDAAEDVDLDGDDE